MDITPSQRKLEAIKQRKEARDLYVQACERSERALVDFIDDCEDHPGVDVAPTEGIMEFLDITERAEEEAYASLVAANEEYHRAALGMKG